MMVRLFSRDAVAKSPCTCGSLPGIYSLGCTNDKSIVRIEVEISFALILRIRIVINSNRITITFYG